MNADLLHTARDVGLLAVGALLGFLGSFAMWKWQLKEKRKGERAKHILRAIHLAIGSLTYIRCLLSAKTRGVTGYLDLPENPVDELMAIAVLHLHEAVPLVQRLHNKQQELFAHGLGGADAASAMIQLARDCEPIANQLMKKLEELAELNGVAKPT
jgi:hypothetical protein